MIAKRFCHRNHKEWKLLNSSMWSLMVMESPSLPHNLQMCDLCCLGTPFGFLPFGIIFWPFSIIDLTFASSAWLVWDFYCRINLQRGILFGYLIYLMGRHHTAPVNWLQKLRFLFVQITWCLPSQPLCLNAYLDAPNMVKWGVPEKILQNVQTHWPCVNRTPQSKVMTKSQFRNFPIM